MSSTILLYIQLIMAGAIFLIGLVSFSIGVIILITRSTGREVRALTAQTAQLTQKGLAEEVSGLVGNASALLHATNELVRTTAGIGVFLTLLGVFLMGAACWLILQINFPS